MHFLQCDFVIAPNITAGVVTHDGEFTFDHISWYLLQCVMSKVNVPIPGGSFLSQSPLSICSRLAL